MQCWWALIIAIHVGHFGNEVQDAILQAMNGSSAPAGQSTVISVDGIMAFLAVRLLMATSHRNPTQNIPHICCLTEEAQRQGNSK